MDADDDFDDVEIHTAGSSGPASGFDIDDAFSDGDDVHDMSLQFNSEAVRRELAHAHDGWGTHEKYDLDMEDDFAQKIGFSHSQDADADASVSTLDINGASSPAHSHAHTLSSVAEDSPRSTTPASASSIENGHYDGGFAEVTITDSMDDLGRDAGEPDAYPTVIIDSGTKEVREMGRGGLSPVASAFPRRTTSLRVGSTSSLGEIGKSGATSPSLSPSTDTSPADGPSSTQTDTPPTSAIPMTPLTPRHRPVRSKGPSALEKVISKTRPSFLPPKPRDEDQRHLADWEAMMRLSRVAEEKRRKARDEKRLARERAVEESKSVWEKEIVPDWRAAMKKPALRKLWWNGIPTSLRDAMWERALGNELALSKDSYRICLSRAKRAIAAGTFPTTTLALIEEDIASTIPSLHIFMIETGPLYEELKDLLSAWVVARSDEGLGYVMGVSKVAAMFLLNMSEKPQVFIALRNLLERHCLRSFYGGLSAKDDVEAYYRIFDTLLADAMPKIYFNFKQHQISPAAYLPDWLIPAFLNHVPFEACARIWDVILLEGDAFLYRAALAMLGVLEPRLFFPERTELLAVLSGENKAALEVAKRDGVPLNDGKYQIYGVHEDTLWERIEAMDEWWKESTWARLIQRELPDA